MGAIRMDHGGGRRTLTPRFAYRPEHDDRGTDCPAGVIGSAGAPSRFSQRVSSRDVRIPGAPSSRAVQNATPAERNP